MRRHRQLVMLSLFGLAFALAGAVHAASPKAASQTTLIELFTSQGCSSCPPADRLFKTYASREDIVALTFNVDYWDYLGWKDTLAKHAFSDRQTSYANQRGDGAVYTPQIVVNGITHVIGSLSKKINQAIGTTRRKLTGRTIPLSIAATADAFVIDVGASTSLAKPATVWLAAVTPKVSINIKHGENHGKSLTYYNVVRSISPVGMWSGTQTKIRLNPHAILQGKKFNCAVFVQADSGAVLAASWIKMP